MHKNTRQEGHADDSREGLLERHHARRRRTEVLAAARRNGYQLRPVDVGYIWEMTGRGSRSGYASLCNGKLFAVGTTFDANFHIFIGLVRERQDHYGEPEWKVTQAYLTDVARSYGVSHLTIMRSVKR